MPNTWWSLSKSNWFNSRYNLCWLSWCFMAADNVWWFFTFSQFTADETHRDYCLVSHSDHFKIIESRVRNEEVLFFFRRLVSLFRRVFFQEWVSFRSSFITVFSFGFSFLLFYFLVVWRFKKFSFFYSKFWKY